MLSEPTTDVASAYDEEQGSWPSSQMRWVAGCQSCRITYWISCSRVGGQKLKTSKICRKRSSASSDYQDLF